MRSISPNTSSDAAAADHPAVTRALSYPYAIPERSYLFEAGRVAPLSPGAPPLDLGGRTPVLAVGSNQSPEQLARKFGGDDWGAIPVVRARLRGFDVVYSAHVSGYGAVPATLHPSPGTRVRLAVTWLSPGQLRRMHETETAAGNYVFARIEGLAMTVEHGPALSAVHLYASRHGPLVDAGAPVPLAEVAADDRRWPGRTQAEIQARLRDRLAPAVPLPAFVRAAVDDAAERRRRVRALRPEPPPAADDDWFRVVPV